MSAVRVTVFGQISSDDFPIPSPYVALGYTEPESEEAYDTDVPALLRKIADAMETEPNRTGPVVYP